MLSKLRRRAGEATGFTLIELLVVILIIGILATISIPLFLNQRGKAQDAQAKELARTAQTTIETYALDHSGSYAGVTSPTDLSAIEKTINTSNTNEAYLSVATGSISGYTVTATAAVTHDTYTITMSNGAVDYTCSIVAGVTPGGCTAGHW